MILKGEGGKILLTLDVALSFCGTESLSQKGGNP